MRAVTTFYFSHSYERRWYHVRMGFCFFFVFLLACIGTGKFSLFTLWGLPALGEDGEMVWDISAAELGGYSDISFGSSMLSIYRTM